MRKGSITVFFLLSMLLILSALLALLEGSRFYEISRLTKMQSQTALESVFAEYNTYLWENYRLLACKQETAIEKVEKYGNSRRIEDDFGTNFYQFQVKEMEWEGYTRLTDGNGEGFIQAVSGYMKENLLYETAKKLYNQYEGIKNLQNDSGFHLEDIDQALEKLNEENSSEGSAGYSNSKESRKTKIQDADSKGWLEGIQKLQKEGILSLVLEDTEGISEKKIDITDTVSKRKLPEEFQAQRMEIDWYDKVLLQQYLVTYMSGYTEQKEHALNYEVEYLLGGKESEIENLKSAVTQMLAIREAANFLYLTSHAGAVEEARLLAVAIAGISVNPILIETVKIAILTGWAFIESILDMRTLLTGGKIALIKSDISWTTDLDDIQILKNGYAKAKSSETGLNYMEYAGILLLLQEEHLLAKRAMDMQECTLRKQYKDTQIYMEDWMIEARVTMTYEYAPVFFSVNKIIPDWNYEVTVHGEFQY